MGKINIKRPAILTLFKGYPNKNCDIFQEGTTLMCKLLERLFIFRTNLFVQGRLNLSPFSGISIFNQAALWPIIWGAYGTLQAVCFI
jgi:hypothetical protein